MYAPVSGCFFLSDLVVKRYLWYTYYIPMILIPLFGVFILSYLGKEEYYEMPSRMKLLYLPAVFLILAVFTNDFHQLAFRFPEGQPFSDEQYTYGILYMAVLGWDILLGLYYMIGLLRRFRITVKRLDRKTSIARACCCVSVYGIILSADHNI